MGKGKKAVKIIIKIAELIVALKGASKVAK